MSFADELRRAQQSAQERRQSDEDIYQQVLHSTYEELKSRIRAGAADNRSNIVSGEYWLRPRDPSINPSDCVHEESVYHVIGLGEYGPEVKNKPICKAETRSGFISSSAKVTLTQFGRRLTDDITRLGKKDNVSIWFTPLYTSVLDKQPLSEFDTFEKLTLSTYHASGEVILHYRISL